MLSLLTHIIPHVHIYFKENRENYRTFVLGYLTYQHLQWDRSNKYKLSTLENWILPNDRFL